MAKTDFFKIGQISGSQTPDIAGSFLEGLGAGLKPFVAFEEKRKKADDLTKKYISAIPNVDAINKIPDWMRSDVTNYLASEKKLYADTARQLAGMDSSDPAYMETLDKLQSIQNNFITLNNQLNQFQEDSKEYFKASDNGNISKGFTDGEAEKYNNTASVFTGAGKLNIQNGQLIFNVDGKNLNYSRGEVGDFYSPDFEVQSGIDSIATLVENDGLKGLEFNEAGYARRIQTLLQRGGKERLLSLVYDDDPRFTTAQGLQTPKIMAAINAGKLGVARSLIADELLQGIKTTHSSFLRQYNKRKDEVTGKTDEKISRGRSRVKNTIIDINTAFSRKNKEYFLSQKYNGKPIRDVKFTKDTKGNPLAVFTVLTSTVGEGTIDKITIPYKRGEVIKNLTQQFVQNEFGKDAINDYGFELYDNIVDELQTERKAKQITEEFNEEFYTQ